MTDYEALYVSLCAAHPELRRECPCYIYHLRFDRCLGCQKDWPNQCDGPYRQNICLRCRGTGWVPLPQPEHLDALVRVAKELPANCINMYWWLEDIPWQEPFGKEVRMEAFWSNPLATLHQADARHLPLPDSSVHCVVTSPP